MTTRNLLSGTHEPHDFAWLLQEWSNQLEQAIRGMGAELSAIEVAAGECDSMDHGTLWWAQEFSLLPGNSVWIGSGEAAWMKIGANALQAVGIDTPERNDSRATYLEILGQSLSALASGLTAICGYEVTCPHGEPLDMPPTAGERGCVSLQMKDELVLLCFVASNEFVQKINRQGSAGADYNQSPKTQASDSEPAQPAAAPISVESILGLEMPVSVSFGKSQLCLEEVLELQKGSRIPILQEAEGLVELRVNGWILGWGEVTLINGRYAVRVRRLAGGAERVDQLTSLNRLFTPKGTAS